MRVVFAGTPEFAATALQAIARDHEVVAVFTQPDRPTGRGKKLVASEVKQLATELNIPVLQPERIKTETALIASLKADVMVVVAYGMIIPKAILEIPKHGCLNIHASVLPRWRGAAPIQRAIEAGDPLSGVSIMQMEPSLDTGPVYLTLTTPIELDDTSATLHQRLAGLGAEGIRTVLNELQSERPPTPVTQEHDLATYAHKLDKAEASIDWTLAAQVIQCRIRAFIPWPIAQSHYAGQRIRVWASTVVDFTSEYNGPPGEIVAIDNSGLTVRCGQGFLLLQTLQKDGGKALDAKSFINGFTFQLGQSFLST